MKIYISGQITGLDIEEVEKVFQSCEDDLINAGYEVVNPMKLPRNHDKTWESYMKEDLKALLECDGIFMLDNWNTSKGARLEYRVARSLGLKVFAYSNLF